MMKFDLESALEDYDENEFYSVNIVSDRNTGLIMILRITNNIIKLYKSQDNRTNIPIKKYKWNQFTHPYHG